MVQVCSRCQVIVHHHSLHRRKTVMNLAAAAKDERKNMKLIYWIDAFRWTLNVKDNYRYVQLNEWWLFTVEKNWSEEFSAERRICSVFKIIDIFRVEILIEMKYFRKSIIIISYLLRCFNSITFINWHTCVHVERHNKFYLLFTLVPNERPSMFINK